MCFKRKKDHIKKRTNLVFVHHLKVQEERFPELSKKKETNKQRKRRTKDVVSTTDPCNEELLVVEL